MCGRYAAFLPGDALAALFQLAGPLPNWAPTWNMAPTRSAPAVRLHPEARDRRLDLLRWGLVPHGIASLKETRHPINARAETLATTPMFRDAFARRRCLIPADAFYEWQTADGAKLPWAIARADGAPMVFGGVWEGWRSPESEIIRSFAIVTTAACPASRPLHERMPLILEAADWPLWLGEVPGNPASLLRSSATAFRRWRVATSVNNVRNDSAALLEPC